MQLELKIECSKINSNSVQHLEFIGAFLPLQRFNTLTVLNQHNPGQPADLSQKLPTTTGVHGGRHLCNKSHKIPHALPSIMAQNGICTKQRETEHTAVQSCSLFSCLPPTPNLLGRGEEVTVPWPQPPWTCRGRGRGAPAQPWSCCGKRDWRESSLSLP